MTAAINRLLLVLWCAAPSRWFRKGGAQMKTPEPSKENPSAPNKREFTGTDNPRHLRAIAALLRRPLPRENLDTVAGCSNGPELVAELILTV